jgi:Zn-finger nucleic acid-binding protein
MANCPHCQGTFRTVRHREGIFYQCDQCAGRAVTLPQIRRTTGDRLATQITNRLSKATELSHLGCTFCGSPMKMVEIPNPGMFVSGCKPCGMVWFEAGKFEALPEGAIDSPEALQMRGVESLGQWKLDELKQRQSAEEGASSDAPEAA